PAARARRRATRSEARERLGGEIHRAIRLRRIVDGAVPLNDREVGVELRLLGSEMGFDVPPRVCASDYIPTPVVLGIVSPTVLVPSELDARLEPEDLRMLLAHELAHVRRGDLALALVPAFAAMVFAFHPLIGLAGREWATEREAACDADAIAATGGSPARYGALLLKILTLDIAVPYRGGGLSPALGATANLHSLKRRLMLMKLTARRPSPVTIGLSALALLGALGLGAATPAFANRLPAADANLVKDGGFESGALAKNWEKGSLLGDAEAMGVSVTEDATVAHSGKTSLRFDRTTQRYNPVLILDVDAPLDLLHVAALVEPDRHRRLAGLLRLDPR
ncbi:M56 family metallopeptidase, partial [bacterium]